MRGANQTSPIDRDLPIFVIVYLPQSWEKHRIQCSLSWLRVYALVVIYNSIHQSSPINGSGTSKQILAHLLGIVIDGQLGICAIDCIIGIIGALGIFVHIVIMDSKPYCRSKTSVHERKFPILFIVNLFASNKDSRPCEHRAYLDGLLVGYAPEELFEGEHYICSIGYSGIVWFIVVLRECLLFELSICADRKTCPANQCQQYST